MLKARCAGSTEDRTLADTTRARVRHAAALNIVLKRFVMLLPQVSNVCKNHFDERKKGKKKENRKINSGKTKDR